MKEVWKLIDTKLQEIAPQLLEELNKGITNEELEILEKAIDTKLPTEFIDFYKIHNGQKPDSAGLFDCEEFLSFESILAQWKIWKDLLDSKDFEDENGPYTSSPAVGIKNNWWNPLWIPITHDGCGNHYCLDLDPTEKGNRGQIIRMWHDDAERSLEANSFKEWILNYAKKLESGELIYSEDYFGIIDKNNI